MIAEDSKITAVESFSGTISARSIAERGGIKLCAADPSIPPLPPIYDRRAEDKGEK